MTKKAIIFFSLMMSAGCPDPVADDLEADQGPEAPGVPEGPLHRAGQRCLACHREGGPSPPFAFAGTVVRRERELTPAEGVTVNVRDSRGEERTAVTNSVGNFYLEEAQWKPVFPVKADLQFRGRHILMNTQILREGSCNACHKGQGGPNTMPLIYLDAVTP